MQPQLDTVQIYSSADYFQSHGESTQPGTSSVDLRSMAPPLWTACALLIASAAADSSSNSRSAILSSASFPQLRSKSPPSTNTIIATATRTDLLAMGGGGSGGWAAAGGLAGLALASEVLQVVNTLVGMIILNRVTKASSFAELVEVVARSFNKLGWVAVPAYALLLHCITILPLMSAILFIVLAGTVFGPVKGTFLVSISLSSAAAISATLSRRIARQRGFSLRNLDEKAAAVDLAIAKKSWHTPLLLVTLLRLSPVLPFTFSNYLAGITSIELPIFFLGTLLGTLPTQAIYVSAGALGRKALQGGVKLPKEVMLLGVLATAAAVLLIGHVASQTIKAMDLESEAKVKA